MRRVQKISSTPAPPQGCVLPGVPEDDLCLVLADHAAVEHRAQAHPIKVNPSVCAWRRGET